MLITGVNYLQTYLERFLDHLPYVRVLWLKKSSKIFINYLCLSYIFLSFHFIWIYKCFIWDTLDCVQLDLLWQGHCSCSVHWYDAGGGNWFNLTKLVVLGWNARGQAKQDSDGTHALWRVNEHFQQDLRVNAVALSLERRESLFLFAGLVNHIYNYSNSEDYFRINLQRIHLLPL